MSVTDFADLQIHAAKTFQIICVILQNLWFQYFIIFF